MRRLAFADVAGKVAMSFRVRRAVFLDDVESIRFTSEVVGIDVDLPALAELRASAVELVQDENSFLAGPDQRRESTDET